MASSLQSNAKLGIKLAFDHGVGRVAAELTRQNHEMLPRTAVPIELLSAIARQVLSASVAPFPLPRAETQAIGTGEDQEWTLLPANRDALAGGANGTLVQAGRDDGETTVTRNLGKSRFQESKLIVRNGLPTPSQIGGPTRLDDLGRGPFSNPDKAMSTKDIKAPQELASMSTKGRNVGQAPGQGTVNERAAFSTFPFSSLPPIEEHALVYQGALVTQLAGSPSSTFRQEARGMSAEPQSSEGDPVFEVGLGILDEQAKLSIKPSILTSASTPLSKTSRNGHQVINSDHSAMSLSVDDQPANKNQTLTESSELTQSKQQIQGDVFLDGALVGRWLSRLLARESDKASASKTGFDLKRGRIFPGPTVGI